jgi:hypothetical protein
MRAYRRALGRLFGLAASDTRAALIFLAAGRVVEVGVEGEAEAEGDRDGEG